MEKREAHELREEYPKTYRKFASSKSHPDSLSAYWSQEEDLIELLRERDAIREKFFPFCSPQAWDKCIAFVMFGPDGEPQWEALGVDVPDEFSWEEVQMKWQELTA